MFPVVQINSVSQHKLILLEKFDGFWSGKLKLDLQKKLLNPFYIFNWCFVANYKHAARNLDLPIEVLLLLFLSVLLFPGRVFDAFLLTTGIVFS